MTLSNTRWMLIAVIIIGSCVHCSERNVRSFPFEIEVQISGISQKIEDSEKWCVVAAPAGDVPRYNYLVRTHRLILDSARIKNWNFLPLPANQGFIIDAIGSDQFPIEVLIVAEQIETGTMLEVRLLGALEVSNQTEKKVIIVAIPHAQERQIIAPKDFSEFMIEYDAIRYLIQNWYLNHRGVGSYDMMQWQNEQFALSIINEGIQQFEE